MKVTLTYESPVPAPIVKGTKIAELEITAPSLTEAKVVPLVAGEDVALRGPFGRIFGSIKYLILGAP